MEERHVVRLGLLARMATDEIPCLGRLLGPARLALIARMFGKNEPMHLEFGAKDAR